MKQLKVPSLCNLLKLAITTNFPATREDVIAVSLTLDFKHEVAKFINPLPEGEYFPNSDAFLERCEELETAIENGSLARNIGDSSGLKLS